MDRWVDLILCHVQATCLSSNRALCFGTLIYNFLYFGIGYLIRHCIYYESQITSAVTPFNLWDTFLFDMPYAIMSYTYTHFPLYLYIRFYPWLQFYYYIMSFGAISFHRSLVENQQLIWIEGLIAWMWLTHSLRMNTFDKHDAYFCNNSFFFLFKHAL